MRQTLLRIWFENPWAPWTPVAGDVPLLGAGWVWLIAGSLFVLFHLATRNGSLLRDPISWLAWGIGFLVLTFAPTFGLLPESLPIFGYGTMVLIGFVCALTFAMSRARAVGFNPEHVLDSAFWILLAGIAGGRLAYLLQYGRFVFRDADTLGEFLFAAVNLSEGGLVLIGAMAGGGLGFLAFCRRRKLSPLEFGDLLIPAAFIGIGFGRIGCLLNGCCFGDSCALPWAITFPQNSLTFQTLVERGFVDPAAAATMPLHPTQIYSALNGFILAAVTGTFYWYRRSAGDVLALGCILYPLTRILIEFLRADEMGQLGTALTISQYYSLIILAMGVALLCRGLLHRTAFHRPRQVEELSRG